MDFVSDSPLVEDERGEEVKDEQARATILVVDDEEDIRAVLQLTLTRAGYDVREAEDGESALISIEGDPPDLVILDVLMPGMDGFEVCRRVRSDAQTAHIPVLMFSARTDRSSREEGMRAGATAYLTKPQAPDKLIGHVANALRSRGA